MGYWNERRGYVNTAVYKPVVEEFYGLQNRTYVITTILVNTTSTTPVGAPADVKYLVINASCRRRRT